MIRALLAMSTVLAGPQVGPTADTLVLRPRQAFELALEASPGLEASRRRTAAADALLTQTGAWPNPVLSVTTENLGATRRISGVPGVEGIEGQALVSGVLPIGGDRGAAHDVATARLLEARSLAARTEVDVRATVVQALARAVQDGERLRRMQAEVTGLETLAEALTAQARLGRISAGEAARAHLAMVSAHTAAAEVAAEAAASREDLTLVLGLEPGTPVRVQIPVCEAPDSIDGAPAGRSDPARSPEVLVASARRQLATAGVAHRRAARVPDLVPQVGVRRAAGFSALYLGFSMELPLFDRGSAAVEAALAEEAAFQAELVRVEGAAAAEIESARQGLLALEAVRSRYTTEWARALDQAVEAADARYRLGEGTLTELLDGRRARLQALDDYERWRARLFTQRAHLARVAGDPIDASMLCGASLPLKTHTPEDRP